MATRRSGPPIDFTGRRRRRRQRLLRTAGALAGVVVVAGVIYAATHKGHLPGPFGGRQAERPSFTFTFASVKGYTLGKSTPAKSATEKEAKDIQHALSEFYIDTLLDPNTWAKGVPSSAWKIFAPAARKEALRHTSSFTVGKVAPSIQSLSVAGSALSVRVLFGPSGKPTAATAVAALRANGMTKNGQRLELSNRAGFVLRPSSGDWLIVGYPKVRTSIKSRPGSASQGASP